MYLHSHYNIAMLFRWFFFFADRNAKKKNQPFVPDFNKFREHENHYEYLKAVSTLKKKLKVKNACTLDCIGRESIVSHAPLQINHIVL